MTYLDQDPDEDVDFRDRRPTFFEVSIFLYFFHDLRLRSVIYEKSVQKYHNLVVIDRICPQNDTAECRDIEVLAKRSY